MKDNLFSYCLFNQSGKVFNRFGHDKFCKLDNRYWLNIPYILIANNHMFKSIKTKIYIQSSLKNHPLYPLLNSLSEKLDTFILQHIDLPFAGTEASMWRVMPFWEDTEYFFCRDIDSIVTEREAKAILHFMKSKFIVNNIRGISQHNGKGASLMAGLSGFHVPSLKEKNIIPKSFNDYFTFYKRNIPGPEWGCDQKTLVKYFIETKKIMPEILDIFLQPMPTAKPVFRGKVKQNVHYNIKSINGVQFDKQQIPGTNPQITKMINNRSTWAGEPVNAAGAPLKNLIQTLNDECCKIIKNEINNNQNFKSFYGI